MYAHVWHVWPGRSWVAGHHRPRLRMALVVRGPWWRTVRTGFLRVRYVQLILNVVQLNCGRLERLLGCRVFHVHGVQLCQECYLVVS